MTRSTMRSHNPRSAPRRPGRRAPRALLAGALLASLLAAAAGCDRGASSGDDPAAAAAAPVRLATASQAGQIAGGASSTAESSRRTALVTATARLSPAVVSITVSSRQRAQPRTPWDMFFLPQEAEQVVQSYGTGFVIAGGGVIITNQHVVAGAERILVTLPDGTEREATLLGEDAMTDIAVVKIDRGNLPVAPLGRSDDLMAGEWVLAMGNPYAYLLGNSEPTVTAGVVSATGRNILPTSEQPGLYLDMIQTDAAINPGNSGGPLANALGEVVGVNSSIFSSSGGSIGLGFAIPIERAMRVAQEIIRSGAVRRAWTGLDVRGPESMRDWKRAGGVVVTDVAPGGPAARAGVRPGDVLVEAAGRRLRNYLDWEAVKLDLHVGDTVRVVTRRGDATATRTLVSGDLPTVSAAKVNVLRDMQLVTVTPAIRAERGLRSEAGALIFRVSDQVARATGLRQGDVLVGIGRVPIRSAEQVAELLRSLQPGTPFRLTFERDGRYLITDLAFQ
ncbi:MAG TPA: trypsin-like peptidase domain-containing protein [Gemmatimonadales bacterium]|nr:trypsin-like peptidase domain-containing protein [Gemmatimonadales bacterium]